MTNRCFQSRGKPAFLELSSTYVRPKDPWTDWATRFSEQLASAEKKGDSPDAYYECWLEAAEDWLSEKGLVDPAIRDQVKAEMLSEQLSVTLL